MRLPEIAKTTIGRIKQASTREEKMSIALEFFAQQGSYNTEPLGWGEDYSPARDHGPEIAKLALGK